MSTRYYALTPQDAWFFRDGRPYNEEESNQSDVPSIFPPPARTLSGGHRAAHARANGWDGKPGGWPPNATELCGSSPNDLGKLRFTGPFLLKDNQALWPAPRHLLGCVENERWKPVAFLRPGENTCHTDAGEIKLTASADGLQSVTTTITTQPATPRPFVP